MKKAGGKFVKPQDRLAAKVDQMGFKSPVSVLSHTSSNLSQVLLKRPPPPVRAANDQVGSVCLTAATREFIRVKGL